MRPVTLVVCEGETEREYFLALMRRFRVNNTQVHVANNTVGSSPTSVVKCAQQKFAEFSTVDAIFCVFDRDAHTDFDKARNQISQLRNRKTKPLPIQEAVSVPCIELWFLLHYEYSTAPHASFDAIRPALRRFILHYEKADRVIADALVVHVEMAIVNAVRLEAEAREAGFSNPFSNVHTLATHITGLANS